MNILRMSNNFRVAVMASAIILATAAAVVANDDQQGPLLPAVCAAIEVPQGHRPVLQVYAIGVQIYRWNGSAWDFVAPSATLYDLDAEVMLGQHFAGPTWMSNGGSSVVAARVDGCTPDPSAIPWLLLRKTRTDGEGLFSGTSYIQRVNTTGGLAPSAPGRATGVITRVPYTAEYYFYESESTGFAR